MKGYAVLWVLGFEPEEELAGLIRERSGSDGSYPDR